MDKLHIRLLAMHIYFNALLYLLWVKISSSHIFSVVLYSAVYCSDTIYCLYKRKIVIRKIIRFTNYLRSLSVIIFTDVELSPQQSKKFHTSSHCAKYISVQLVDGRDGVIEIHFSFILVEFSFSMVCEQPC